MAQSAGGRVQPAVESTTPGACRTGSLPGGFLLVDGSERGGPGLPSPGGRTAPGEPPRPNRRWVRSFPPLVRPDRSLLTVLHGKGDKRRIVGLDPGAFA